MSPDVPLLKRGKPSDSHCKYRSSYQSVSGDRSKNVQRRMRSSASSRTHQDSISSRLIYQTGDYQPTTLAGRLQIWSLPIVSVPHLLTSLTIHNESVSDVWKWYVKGVYFTFSKLLSLIFHSKQYQQYTSDLVHLYQLLKTFISSVLV